MTYFVIRHDARRPQLGARLSDTAPAGEIYAPRSHDRASGAPLTGRKGDGDLERADGKELGKHAKKVKTTVVLEHGAQTGDVASVGQFQLRLDFGRRSWRDNADAAARQRANADQLTPAARPGRGRPDARVLVRGHLGRRRLLHAVERRGQVPLEIT